MRRRVTLDARALLYACLPAAQLPAPPYICHGRFDECAQGTPAPQSAGGAHRVTSAVDAVSASSVSSDVRRAAYLPVRSVSVGRARSATRPFSSTTSSERG